jgi:hypothetical protein
MKIIIASCLIFAITIFTSFQVDEYKASNDEIELCRIINEYRKSLNLTEIPLSNKLTKVAKIHCKDLYDNFVRGSSECNEHSWSDKGIWTPVCYTPDHKRASDMWNKPKEIANYLSNGYEIEHNHSPKDDLCNPMCALNGWKNSAGHNSVMTNQGKWKEINFKAMGVGIYKGYACVWFGELEDK